jgi:hypothetical protein
VSARHIRRRRRLRIGPPVKLEELVNVCRGCCHSVEVWHGENSLRPDSLLVSLIQFSTAIAGLRRYEDLVRV